MVFTEREPAYGVHSVVQAVRGSPAGRSRPIRRMISASGAHNNNMRAPRMMKLSLTPQRSAIPPISGGIMIEVSR